MISFIFLGIVTMVFVHSIFKIICDVIDSIQIKRDKRRKDKEWKIQCEEFRKKYGPRN